MNHFMAHRYALAAEEARHTVTGLPNLPFYWLLLAASLVHDGRQNEADKVLADFRTRHPNFDLSIIETRLWPATQSDFVRGRDRIVATVREKGLR